MARKWSDVRRDAVESGLIDEQRPGDAKKRGREAVRAYKLAEVRKAQDVRQIEIAASMDVAQSRVSKIERGDLSHTEIGTLGSYVAALGGTLRVVADFGDEQLTLR